MPVAEFGYINIYGRDITNTRKAKKYLEKMTFKKTVLKMK
jgi:hypothetical protein